MNHLKAIGAIAIGAFTLAGCGSSGKQTLPVLGRKQVVEREVNGVLSYDTVDHTIAPFGFYDQDSAWITPKTFEDKIYVADFFFTSCPTICPKMKKQMLRVYDRFKTHDRVALLSHTIDPKHDSVAVLRRYADALGASSKTWHFVTGDREEIYRLGEKSYMVTAGEDASAPGGYIHSGAFLLVDDKKRIRGAYDGTSEAQVDELMDDMEILLQSINHESQ